VFIHPRNGPDFPARFSQRGLRQHPFLCGRILTPRTDPKMDALLHSQQGGAHS
jgi:hypothetical protein